MGRPASLDKENRVICGVYTGAKRAARNYSQVRVIHPAIGVKMERIKGWRGNMRPQVPAPVMRPYSMCQAALLAKDPAFSQEYTSPFSRYSAASSQTQDPCFICFRAAVAEGLEDGAEAAADPQGSLQSCPFCLLPAHGSCRKTLVGEAQKTGGVAFPENVEIAAAELPIVFDSETRQLACKVETTWVLSLESCLKKSTAWVAQSHLQVSFQARA